MPRKNAKDLEEVPKKVMRDMTLVQVGSMDEVLNTALARMPKPLSPKPRRVARVVRATVNKRRARTIAKRKTPRV